MQICQTISDFGIYILSRSPNPEFLSDIAAFEAVLIALVIPLSFDIVARISERYQSEVIVKMFIRERVNRILPPTLLINIVLAISLRFFVNSNPVSLYWKIIAWIILLGFMFIVIILSVALLTLQRYVTDTEFVQERLFHEAEESIK